MSLQKKAISDPATHTKNISSFFDIIETINISSGRQVPFLVSTHAKESEMMQKPFSK
jgi:hypothetical protein